MIGKLLCFIGFHNFGWPDFGFFSTPSGNFSHRICRRCGCSDENKSWIEHQFSLIEKKFKGFIK